jgi:hypothetical protein
LAVDGHVVNITTTGRRTSSSTADIEAEEAVVEASKTAAKGQKFFIKVKIKIKLN